VVRRGRSRDQVAARLRRRDEKPLAVNRTAARGQRQESKSEELSLLLIRGLTKRLALLKCRRVAEGRPKAFGALRSCCEPHFNQPSAELLRLGQIGFDPLQNGFVRRLQMGRQPKKSCARRMRQPMAGFFGPLFKLPSRVLRAPAIQRPAPACPSPRFLACCSSSRPRRYLSAPPP
jgi:hypothetical protein